MCVCVCVFIPSAERDVLALLDAVLSLQFLSDNLGFALLHRLVTPEQAETLTAAVRVSHEKLRPSIVGLVSAFGYPDWMLNSTLGSGDGEIYKHILDRATAATGKLRNKEGKTPYWDELVKPLLKAKL